MDLIQERIIRDCHREVSHLTGDVAEIGVYQGESAELITGLFQDSTVHLFDTFQGMPKEMHVEGLDGNAPGSFNGNKLRETVANRLYRYGSQVKIHQGVFPKTAAGLKPRLKFVHIDCDLYLSTKEALKWAWELLEPGGIALDDDCYCTSCHGARKAIDEFVLTRQDALVEKRDRLAIIRKIGGTDAS